MTSPTLTETVEQLRARADEARVEFDNLKSEVDQVPGKLAEVDRRLKTSTDEKIIRELIKKRSQLQDAKEVKPLLLRGAHVRMLRAKAAFLRAEGQEIAAGYQAAVTAERESKIALDEATAKYNDASANRLSIERREGGRRFSADQCSTEADELEAAR